MDKKRNSVLLRSVEDLADATDLRAVISKELVRSPIDESALRCAVWSFVGTERRAGIAAAVIIARLTALVDEATGVPIPARLALTRRMILWCVEEYFGRLDGEVLGNGAAASLDLLTTTPMGV